MGSYRWYSEGATREMYIVLKLYGARVTEKNVIFWTAATADHVRLFHQIRDR